MGTTGRETTREKPGPQGFEHNANLDNQGRSEVEARQSARQSDEPADSQITQVNKSDTTSGADDPRSRTCSGGPESPATGET